MAAKRDIRNTPHYLLQCWNIKRTYIDSDERSTEMLILSDGFLLGLASLVTAVAGLVWAVRRKP